VSVGCNRPGQGDEGLGRRRTDRGGQRIGSSGKTLSVAERVGIASSDGIISVYLMNLSLRDGVPHVSAATRGVSDTRNAVQDEFDGSCAR
jgi:hypothetical protein